MMALQHERVVPAFAGTTLRWDDGFRKVIA